MIRDVVTPDTTPAEWDELRSRVRQRVRASLGTPPNLSFAPDYEPLDEFEAHGLLMKRIKFEATPGYVTHGTLVFPSGPVPRTGRHGVLCMHGTDRDLAHRNVLSPDEKPDRQYAIELARRGYVALAVDQFGFGAGNRGFEQHDVIRRFYEGCPEWSLDGIRLWIHQCALDILSAQDGVAEDYLACIGHSLGGRAAAYLAAFDDRIAAAVPSAGVSPNVTNVYRNVPGAGSLSPVLDEAVAQAGKPFFEYQDLIALCAPRALLLVEPWNDAYNPYIETVFRCFEKARFVYELYGEPDNLQILCHGDGHDTRPPIREYAYRWIDEKLSAAASTAAE